MKDWLNWSADCSENVIDKAIRDKNVPMVQLLLKYKKKYDENYYKYQADRVQLPKNQLKVGTGSVGLQTLGVKVRKVKAARGGKEGNNVCFVMFCRVAFLCARINILCVCVCVCCPDNDNYTTGIYS